MFDLIIMIKHFQIYHKERGMLRYDNCVFHLMNSNVKYSNYS